MKLAPTLTAALEQSKSDPDNYELCPDNLESMADMVRELRHLLLFSFEEDGIAPMANAHLLSALAQMEVAAQSLSIAGMEHTKALASVQLARY